MTEEQLPPDGVPRTGPDPTDVTPGPPGGSLVPRDGTTLLEYEIRPEPSPLQAGAPATLTLVVSNGTSAMVTCERITLTLPVGTNAKDLVANAEGITSQAPAGWSVGQNGGTFTLTPQVAAAGQIGARGLSFGFSGLAVNAQVGTTIVTIGETASTRTQPSLERTGTIPLSKFPPQFALSGLTADPLEVQAGGSTTLIWSGSPATYQLEFNPGNGVQTVPVGNAGTYVARGLTGYPAVFFTLTASYAVPGQDQPVVTQRQTIVQVDAALPAVTSFSGSAAGGEVTLQWDSANADSCSLNVLPQLLKPSGSATVPVDRIRYTLVANSSRTETSSAPAFVDLHMSVAREQPLGHPGSLGHWLGLADDGSQLVLVAELASSDMLEPLWVWLLLDRATLNLAHDAFFWTEGSAFALSSDGTRFFTCTQNPSRALQLVSVLAIPSYEWLDVPRTFDTPLGAVFSPDGATLYVAGTNPAAIHVFDASLVEQRSFPIPAVGNCAVSGDGSRLYVAAGSSLFIIDSATGAVLGQPPIGDAGSGGIVVDAARNRAYVSGQHSGTVSIVDLAAMTTLGQVPVGSEPLAIAMGPGGDEIYVANSRSQSITVIDANTLEVITTLSLPDDPAGLVVAPGAPLTLYALTNTDAQVPVVCVLEVTS